MGCGQCRKKRETTKYDDDGIWHPFVHSVWYITYDKWINDEKL